MSEQEETPVDGTGVSSPDEIDLEGCTAGERHCHARRSLRQETALTPEGKRRVCHRPAGSGTEHVGEGVCKLHGGNSASYMSKIRMDRKRKALEEARLAYGVPLDVDPATALLEEVQRTAGAIVFLEAKIRSLAPEEMVWGVVREVTEWAQTPDSNGVRSTDSTVERKAQVNQWVKLYQDERRHLTDVSARAIQAGAQASLVDMLQKISQVYIRLVERVVDRLGLTSDQRAQLPEIMTAELSALITPDSDRAEYVVTELESGL